ncbi:MAG: aminoglycoside phosphotransferase [Ponticaulis sp.]|nr:aminoglycoside phosphotransferase [Ponticaulis sp.]|tara:strand:- start:48164 stop:49261 length:1098 start_codon:yes stop_codon:yes gene_type:complete
MNTLTDPDRSAEILDFLSQAGLSDVRSDPINQDASTRRYERLIKDDKSYILMDAPPANEEQPCGPDASERDRILAGWNGRTRLAASRVDAFVGIGEHLRSIGLSAPEVLAFDVERGLCLLEDLGNRVFAREIEQGLDERSIYRPAADALIRAHLSPTPHTVTAGDYIWPILDYDRLALTTGADLFPKWYPAFDERVRFSGDLAAQYDDVIATLSEHLTRLPKVLLLRDYHAENLIWLPERSDVQRVGILDFQDAVRGPAAWDLAMFLQDARRDVSPDLQAELIDHYLAETGYDSADFGRDYAIAGAVNALRIIGVFARLISRDGKPRYNDFLPREWGHLKQNLQHEALADLRRILETAAPFLKSE